MPDGAIGVTNLIEVHPAQSSYFAHPHVGVREGIVTSVFLQFERLRDGVVSVCIRGEEICGKDAVLWGETVDGDLDAFDGRSRLAVEGEVQAERWFILLRGASG